MTALQSSNPILGDTNLGPVVSQVADRNDVATVSGVINRTTLLVGAAVVSGAVAFSLVQPGPAVWVINLVAFGVTLAVFFAIRGKAFVHPGLAFTYAIAEGAALGAVSRLLETILVQQGIKMAAGGLALQAFVVTAGVMLATLALYRLGIVRPTERFVSIISSVVGGICVTYLVGFALSFFGIQLPFLSLGSALQGGTPALIGLGLNAVILVVAALTLVIDFGQVDAAVEAGAPRRMEWYLAFGLTVTLAWVYMEALKLVFRLALLFSDRR